MTKQTSKSQFKAKALEYFRVVEATGEPVVITDHGRPVLEVRRYQTATEDPLARLEGSVVRFDRPFDPIDEDAWDLLK
jgi:PHD/YefM family antitoxin component YafN of YafNO toxin-antitoxin module